LQRAMRDATPHRIRLTGSPAIFSVTHRPVGELNCAMTSTRIFR
jgi:hypothetical protein